VVRSTIELGHSLGLAVVAEGVEDPEVLAHLQALGCDLAQGFGLGRPLPPHELRWPHNNNRALGSVEPLAA
jgi:diguanylate cyclase